MNRKFENYKYRKVVKASDSGLVFAEVYRICADTNEDLERVGYQFWGTIFGLKRAMKKAHKWADKRISILEEQESGTMTYASLDELYKEYGYNKVEE